MIKTLGCLLRADAISDLLRTAREQGTQYPNRAMGERQAHAIISAALWLHSVRDDSTSACYAWSALNAALSGCTWEEARAMRQSLGLHWAGPEPTAAEARALRVALGLRHDPWDDHA